MKKLNRAEEFLDKIETFNDTMNDICAEEETFFENLSENSKEWLKEKK